MKRILAIILSGVAVICSAAPSFAQQDTLRILGVGNSWTRDSMRWLSAIAASAGKLVIVGHAYLGGSTLEQQYHGIDDTTYTYKHRNIDQVVHNTYQYWKYSCTQNPVKTPAKGYKNGLAGIGVTLESVVRDEPWNIVVFQPHVIVKAHMPEYCGFDINHLVSRIKKMMEPGVAKSVRCGIMIPFSYPEGNTDYRQNVVDAYNGGVRPSTQDEWDQLYETMHCEIQKDAIRLSEHMGENCSFVINVGQAIYNARAERTLSKYGYKLQRAQNNTHLAEGIPMYIASLCYAYVLLGLTPDEISFYPKLSKDFHLTGDKGETIQEKKENSPGIAEYARDHVYKSLGLK
jgi:hypothetical protein